MRYTPFGPEIVRVRFPSNKIVVTMNPFDYFLTREIMEIKISKRGPIMCMDLGENYFYAHFSRDGKYQLTWRIGDDYGFYFCKHGRIVQGLKSY